MKQYPGLPDGMTVAKDGTLFGSGPGGIYVLSANGKLLGRILTKGRVSNCSFDTGQKYLYMTADNLLCRVKMK